MGDLLDQYRDALDRREQSRGGEAPPNPEGESASLAAAEGRLPASRIASNGEAEASFIQEADAEPSHIVRREVDLASVPEDRRREIAAYGDAEAGMTRDGPKEESGHRPPNGQPMRESDDQRQAPDGDLGVRRHGSRRGGRRRI